MPGGSQFNNIGDLCGIPLGHGGGGGGRTRSVLMLSMKRINWIKHLQKCCLPWKPSPMFFEKAPGTKRPFAESVKFYNLLHLLSLFCVSELG